MLDWKQILLCHKHHLEFEKGKFSELDYGKLNSIMGKVPRPTFSDFKPIFDGKPCTLDKKAK